MKKILSIMAASLFSCVGVSAVTGTALGLPATCVNNITEVTVNSCADLKSISQDDTRYTLAGNIDCGNTANLAADLVDQTLTCVIIDGTANKYKIENLKAVENVNDLALFKHLKDSAIQNITFQNIDIESTGNNIAIISKLENSIVKNIDILMSKVTGNNTVGLLAAIYEDDYTVGATTNDTGMSDISINASNISSNGNAGLLAGKVFKGFIKSITGNDTTVNATAQAAHSGAVIGNISSASYVDDIDLFEATVIAIGSADGIAFGRVAGDTNISNVNISGSVLRLEAGDPGTPNNFGGLAGLVAANSNINLNNIKVAGIIYDFGNKSSDSAAGLIGTLGSNSNLTVNNSSFTGEIEGFDDQIAGFVGRSNGSVTIKNSFADWTISGSKPDEEIGGFIGDAGRNVTIEDSFTKFTTAATDLAKEVGGFIGEIDSAANNLIIKRSYALVDITSNNSSSDEFGGLVGRLDADDTLIEQTFTLGEITIEDDNLGGFIGEMGSAISNLTIKDSYSKVDLGQTDTSGRNVGGLLGDSDANPSDTHIITNVYVDGKVVSARNDDEYPILGEEGNNDTGLNFTFTDAYFTDKVSGIVPDLSTNFNTVDSNNRAEELSSVEKKQQVSYNNWDFNSIWFIAEGLDTPVLRNNLLNDSFAVSEINLSFNTVNDGAAPNTKIADLTFTDLDNDNVTCTLKNSSSDLKLVNDVLFTNTTIDKSVTSEYNITIECVDDVNQTPAEKSFVITVVTPIPGSPNPTIDLSQSPVIDPQAPAPLSCADAEVELENNGFDVNSNSNLENLEKLLLALDLNLLVNESQTTSPSANVLAVNHPKFDLNNDGNIDVLDKALDYDLCDEQVNKFLNAAELLDRNLDGEVKKLNKRFKKSFKRARKEFLFDRDRNLATVDENSFYDLFDYNDDDKVNKKDKRFLKRLIRNLNNISIFVNATTTSNGSGSNTPEEPDDGNADDLENTIDLD
jgi:hypothetical protein